MTEAKNIYILQLVNIPTYIFLITCIPTFPCPSFFYMPFPVSVFVCPCYIAIELSHSSFCLVYLCLLVPHSSFSLAACSQL